MISWSLRSTSQRIANRVARERHSEISMFSIWRDLSINQLSSIYQLASIWKDCLQLEFLRLRSCASFPRTPARPARRRLPRRRHLWLIFAAGTSRSRSSCSWQPFDGAARSQAVLRGWNFAAPLAVLLPSASKESSVSSRESQLSSRET